MSIHTTIRTLARNMRNRLVLRACIRNDEWTAIANALDAAAVSDGQVPTHLPENTLVFTPPRHGFTCFHCGSHFPLNDEGIVAATEHFGKTPETVARCKHAADALSEAIEDLIENVSSVWNTSQRTGNAYADDLREALRATTPP